MRNAIIAVSAFTLMSVVALAQEKPTARRGTAPSPGSGRQCTSEHDPADAASRDPLYEGLSTHLFDELVPGAGASASFVRDRLSDEDRPAVVAGIHQTVVALYDLLGPRTIRGDCSRRRESGWPGASWA